MRDFYLFYIYIFWPKPRLLCDPFFRILPWQQFVFTSNFAIFSDFRTIGLEKTPSWRCVPSMDKFVLILSSGKKLRLSFNFKTRKEGRTTNVSLSSFLFTFFCSLYSMTSVVKCCAEKAVVTSLINARCQTNLWLK